MSPIESNVRGEDLSLRDIEHSTSRRSFDPRRDRDTTASVMKVSVVPSGEEGPCAFGAAELAAIESEKTREKLKIKAEHVATFHRKVVKRLADERRGADAVTGRGRTRQTARMIYSAVGTAYRFPALHSREEPSSCQRDSAILDEVPSHLSTVKVIGKHGDLKSMSDADKDARMKLAAYLVPS